MMLAIQAAPAPVSPPARVATIPYVVKRGDTLEALSRRYLQPQRGWRALRPLARARDPRHLPVGLTIDIPRAWLRYTVEPATLASYRGTVTIVIGGRAVTPTPGMTIGEGAVMSTAANSFVTLTLADRSKLVLPSQSSFTVREIRRIVMTGAIDYRLTIARGRLETKVSPIGDPTGRYRIGTPVSMTAVRGTEFRVAFDEAATSATAEVLAGTVAVSPADETNPLLVDKAFGATTDAAGNSKRATLLPAPDLADPGKMQTDDLVRFHLTAVPGATKYRAVLAADSGFIENLTEQIVAGQDFALPQVPNGNLFVRVSAISPDGLEGLAQTYTVTRRLASLHGEAAAEAEGFRFRWSGAGSGQRRYHFQLMPGRPDGAPVVDEVGLTRDELLLHDLPAGVYYWRVGLYQIDASGEAETWTDPEKLTIANPGRRRGR
ncbi:FecR domain-containing protein [Sphingomonas sp. AR_OL41]|uniref:FecR domain-containing protein n=1 Tax=Sphingomonas sp. AR_OL41 TaxID=3042729 RepID=UPI0024810B2A|nr:FecR domain-containing protein [Sphingomonas sp. AR_OL41]MDH7972065.1 FecR domain-containing protein [Sphingomonas sp. AR_OL41]